MRILIFVLAFINLTSSCSQHEIPDKIIWESQFINSGHDSVQKVISTSDNNFLLIGYGESRIEDESPFKKNNAFIWIIKVDKLGNEIWSKKLGSDGIDRAFSGLENHNGDYIITGYKSKLFEDQSIGSQWMSTFYIANISSNGKINWEKNYGGMWGNYAVDIIEGHNDELIIVGNSSAKDNGYELKGKNDAVLLILTSGGLLKEIQNFGGSSYDEFYKSFKVEDGYLIFGSSNSKDGDISDKSKELYNLWVLKVDKNAKKIYSKSLSSPNADVLKSAIKTGEGYMLYGESKIGGVRYPLIVSCDMDGNELWRKHFPLNKGGSVHSMIEYGNLYLIGSILYKAESDIEKYASSIGNPYLSLLDNKGNILETKKISDLTGEIFSLSLTSENELQATGAFKVDGKSDWNFGAVLLGN